METAVGTCNGVRYSVDVRYWECPLIESPLYNLKDDDINCYNIITIFSHYIIIRM